jgi:uncharacterized membrane protein
MRRATVIPALSALALSAMALSACGGGDKDPNAPVKAPDVAANFTQPLDARGTEPAWGLKIRGLQFILNRPNQADLVATAPGAVLTPHSASWEAVLPNGQTMKVSLFASQCSDGAGATYPFSAEVLLRDSTPLTGCAGKPAASVRR